MTNISLVGFGRIGRDLLRQTFNDNDINIISISDTAELDIPKGLSSIASHVKVQIPTTLIKQQSAT